MDRVGNCVATALAALSLVFSPNGGAQQVPLLHVTSIEINFGVVPVGDSVSLSFGLQNIGAMVATGVKTYLRAESFHVFDNCPGDLNPGERCSVGVQFSPGRSGYFQRWIVVSSEQHEVLVKLIAQAH